MTTEDSSDTSPFFSIIIPTYNRPEPLAVCLESLSRLHYPRDRFEVIVVDDGGETDLEYVISQVSETIRISLIRQSNAGPGTARNTGAAQAQGDMLVFTDDDCAPASDWLDRMAAYFNRAPGAVIGGRTVNTLTGNPFSTVSELVISYLYTHFNADPDQATFFTTNNACFPKAPFHELKGFDTVTFPRVAEDRDICDRWHRAGFDMVYAPDVVVHHAHPLTGPAFWKQHFKHGRGTFRYRRESARRSQHQIRVEALPFYRDLIRYPYLTGQEAYRPWRSQDEFEQSKSFLSLLMIISQMANTLGFFYEMLQKEE
jgi:GT2 family glycosyltransferase